MAIYLRQIKCSLLALVVLALLSLPTMAEPNDQPVLIVTTDLGQDPDDQQSLVRLLHYLDRVQLAGIITNADNNSEDEAAVLRDDLAHQLIDAYGEVEQNFRIHAPTFPSASYLHQLVKKGSDKNGRNIPYQNYVGAAHDTEGSDWIINVVDQSKSRVNVAVWGGACDLAQALWRIRHERSEAEQDEFIDKLQVYFIGKQDSSNDWILQQFQGLKIILSLAENGNSWDSTYRGMFLGGDLSTTSREWMEHNIIGQNPITKLYPDKAWTGGKNKNPHGVMKEGDSPSLLYFLSNGLNVPEKPEYGGWGGRFQQKQDNRFRDTQEYAYTDTTNRGALAPQATVFRWRTDFQNDFANRVKWATASRYEEANHYPVIQMRNGYCEGELIQEIEIAHEKKLQLDASLSFDPDGDALQFEWILYPEASGLESTDHIHLDGTDTEKVTLSFNNTKEEDIHLILKVSDQRAIPLSSYKRFLIKRKAFLH
ncbi:DUF1593 domain-containing protein [Persicobacter diffluens]|uniref:DUF1593 domain-containing protein n=1 Tax=Persicobacter diffluens TaxID=981 RepID=A0AAN4W4C6_9BACT|nr:hypothetical protein PEDI_48870 [Persicobacter diffluens]